MAEPILRRLWGVGTSRTLRAHWALIELGLDYERLPVRPRTADMDAPAFQAVSPEKKVPILDDGGLILAESPAIVLYLGEHYANEACRLVPAAPRARAQLFEWVSYVCMELDATSLYVLRRHMDLAEIYGEAPSAVEAAKDYFLRMLSRAERQLSDEREYVLGDDFTAADILLASCLNMADRYAVAVPESLNEYRNRIRVRPGFQRAMEANKP